MSLTFPSLASTDASNLSKNARRIQETLTPHSSKIFGFVSALDGYFSNRKISRFCSALFWVGMGTSLVLRFASDASKNFKACLQDHKPWETAVLDTLKGSLALLAAGGLTFLGGKLCFAIQTRPFRSPMIIVSHETRSTSYLIPSLVALNGVITTHYLDRWIQKKLG